MKELNKKTINMITKATEEADIFIVPNNAARSSEFGPFKWDYFFWMKKCLAVNGIKFDTEEEYNNELLVQIWFRTEKSQDAASHGMSIKVDDGEIHYTHPKGYLPYSLIKDMVEGDTKTIKIPQMMFINGINEDDAEAWYPLDVEWTITAKQNEYRYRNFGPFEKALQIVTVNKK